MRGIVALVDLGTVAPTGARCRRNGAVCYQPAAWLVQLKQVCVALCSHPGVWRVSNCTINHMRNRQSGERRRVNASGVVVRPRADSFTENATIHLRSAPSFAVHAIVTFFVP